MYLLHFIYLFIAKYGEGLPAMLTQSELKAPLHLGAHRHVPTVPNG